MIKTESLTDEILVNISLALALQDALVNQIYPEMRRVIGCINHKSKQIVMLVIYDRKISKECADAMEGLLNDVIVEMPVDYSIGLQLERVDFPRAYEYLNDGWYCFYAYFRREELDWSSPRRLVLQAP